MNPILFHRLEREWDIATKDRLDFKSLAIVVEMFARNIEDAKEIKLLKSYIDFLEDRIDDIPLRRLALVLKAIKYARRVIERKIGANTERSGISLARAISSDDRRRAARTLDSITPKGLTNNHLASSDNSDSFDELRGNTLDTGL